MAGRSADIQGDSAKMSYFNISFVSVPENHCTFAPRNVLTMIFDIHEIIGETSTIEKKELLERNKPKSWLKSVSAFANGEGGTIVYGISDDGAILGINDAEHDAEFISEAIKTKIDPTPVTDLQIKHANGCNLILLHIKGGQETPYYYIGDKQRLAYVRIGNQSVVADRIQLKQLVLKGSGQTYDSLSSPYRLKDMSFSKLRSVCFQRLHRSFEDNEFVSWGIVDDSGNLTNAGALLADESPIRHSRVFCTRWNGLTKANGLIDALDDTEISGSVINQLQESIAFVRNNSHKRWRKETDHREELPDYPDRAVTEVIVNAIIHRDYTEVGSEIHIDMYDDRMEVFSPGGMVDGRLIQESDPLLVPSKRRNPLLADCFNRLNLMERRGSGMRKILDSYTELKDLATVKSPVFRSSATEFHVVLFNVNYNSATGSHEQEEFVKKFVKEPQVFAKEFIKARRQIYALISQNPKVTTVQMSEKMKLSSRQVQKYLKKLTDLHLISRVGGRKNGEWVILDEDYDDILGKL